jgi:hypothetical protein
MEVSGQFHRLGKSPRYPLDRRLGGRGGSRADMDAVAKRKISSPHRESDPDYPILQTVASRYTD